VLWTEGDGEGGKRHTAWSKHVYVPSPLYFRRLASRTSSRVRPCLTGSGSTQLRDLSESDSLTCSPLQSISQTMILP
jgi:hypothetical protein